MRYQNNLKRYFPCPEQTRRVSSQSIFENCFKFELIVPISLGIFQESEIVEVLWKQDVDLGYTLATPSTNSTGKESGNATAALSPEESEKLKALQDLKNDKVSAARLPSKLYQFIYQRFPVEGGRRKR